MAEAGLDAYVAFAPETIFWLTGHDTPAYQYLQACLVTADEMPLNLLRAIDASNTLAASWSRRAAIYDDDADPVRLLAALLGERLPPGSRIGIEDDAFFVTPRRYRQLEALLPQHGLRLPSTLVGSRTDPWMTLERARLWAERWGSRFVDLGEAGHINVESGHGPWPYGRLLVDRLIRQEHARRRLMRAHPMELSYAV